MSDKILSHSKGYVKTYKVLKEERTVDGFVMTISATVDTKVLKDDLGDVLTILRNSTAVNNPRILVAYSTKNESGQYLKNKAFVEEIYNGIVESLTDQQFRVVDKSASEQFAVQTAESHGIDVDVNKAAKFGLQYKAEYTLFYNVSGTIRDGVVGKGVILRIKTQLIDNTRSQIITSKMVEKSASAQTVEQALERAARDGGKAVVTPVVERIQKEWMDMQQNGAFYTIVIDGVDDPEQIAGFTEMFEKFPLASQAKEVESGGGKTTFEARYKGKRDQLDRDVLRTARELGWNLKKVRAEGARSSWKRI
jgi:nucleotide-binding universal stress UspA family protein